MSGKNEILQKCQRILYFSLMKLGCLVPMYFYCWIHKISGSDIVREIRIYSGEMSGKYQGSFVNLKCMNPEVCIMLMSLSMRKQTCWCVHNEDLNQPANLCCLISVFVVHMKKLWILGYPKCPSDDSDQTAWMFRLIWIFPGSTCPKVCWHCSSFSLSDSCHSYVFVVFFSTIYYQYTKHS